MVKLKKSGDKALDAYKTLDSLLSHPPLHSSVLLHRKDFERDLTKSVTMLMDMKNQSSKSTELNSLVNILQRSSPGATGGYS